jgi:uncharacterized protein (UPF0261 family)
MNVYLIATLDTKGLEAAWLRDRLVERGLSVRLVDAGSAGQPQVDPQVTSEEVFRAAGTSLAEVRAQGDRGAAVTHAAQGASAIVRRAHAGGELCGVLSIGGSAGTTIGTAAMRALPLGVPKVMVSTLASGQVRPWVGDKDIFMLNAVVDLAGINRVSRLILDQAARAMAGLLKQESGGEAAAVLPDRPIVAATMFGVTTPCVQRAREILEAAGFEVLVFHATGNGGQAMESLIDDGLIAGVLDVTTTELADELVGGVLSAGPDRLTAAGRRGIPQVVSVGALDMVNFHSPETLPSKFASRKFHRHNAAVTLMRTTPEENTLLGAEIGRKLAASAGPAAVFFPLRGVSALDRDGQPFGDLPARRALLGGLRSNLGAIPMTELDCHINDPAFADAIAAQLITFLAPPSAPARSAPGQERSFPR